MASQVAHMGQQQARPQSAVSGNHSDTTLSFHGNKSMNNYHYHQPYQQQQHRPTKMTIEISEKRMQEIRALAYEYVKQIVTKANELSQTTEAVVNEDKQASQSSNNNNTSQITGREVIHKADANALDARSQIPLTSGEVNRTAHTKRLVNEAASQINKRFRFLDDPQVNPSAINQAAARLISTNAQNNPICRQANKQDSSRSTQFNPIRMLDNPTSTAITSEIPSRGLDYIEQDYATMSSSQDDNEEFSRGPASHGRLDNQTTAASGSKQHNWVEEDGGGGGGGGRGMGPTRSRFHQCFNWHLLVSCFSTCLPETLTRHTRANMGPSSV